MRSEPVEPSSSISSRGRSSKRRMPARRASAGAQGVVDVVVDVGDAVDELDDPPLERGRPVRACVVPDSVADLLGEVQCLDSLDHTK